MDMLGLSDIEILDYKEEKIDGQDFLIINAFQLGFIPKCPYCESKSRVHETITRDIRDFDAFDKKVIIRLEVKKCQCLSCNKHFTEQFESVDSHSRMTKRLRDKLSYEAFDYSFAELERRYGFSDTTIKKAFAYWQKEMDDKRAEHLYASKVIGVDETKLCGEMRGVIVDIENNTLLELMEDKKIDSFTCFFDQLKDIDKVKVVNMDMSGGYKTMACDYFGEDIVIVVDKYHAIARIEKAMMKGYNILVGEIKDKSEYSGIDNRMSIIRRDYETLNKDDRKILAKLFKAIPGLEYIYKLKESFRAIYLNENRKDAEEALNKWIESIGSGAELKDYKTASKTMLKWKREILNYFDYPYTNAFTEGFNNLMKRTNRIGNGYSFKVLRGKMLYGSSKTGFHSVKQEIIKKPKENMIPYGSFGVFIYNSNSDEKEIHYGVDINELFAELSSWNTPEE